MRSCGFSVDGERDFLDGVVIGDGVVCCLGGGLVFGGVQFGFLEVPRFVLVWDKVGRDLETFGFEQCDFCHGVHVCCVGDAFLFLVCF